MICRNCKFSLQGSEKFCPNCGSPLSEEVLPRTEQELSPPVPPSIFYTPEASDKRQSEAHSLEDSEDEPLREKKKDKSKKSSSKAPVLLLLLFVFLLLTAGFFLFAQNPEIAPVLLSYLEGASEEETTDALYPVSDEPGDATVSGEYSDSYGIVCPSVSYFPDLAYVADGDGVALRKGPDDSYGLIRKLPYQCQLQILGGSEENELWVYTYIPFYDVYGWLCSSFLTLYSSAQPSSEPFEETTDTKPVDTSTTTTTLQ